MRSVISGILFTLISAANCFAAPRGVTFVRERGPVTTGELVQSKNHRFFAVAVLHSTKG